MSDRNSLRASVQFAGTLIATSFRASLAQRGTFALHVAFMALNNLIFFSFWWVLLGRVSNIRGYGRPEMAILYGVVAAGHGLNVVVAGGARQLAHYIHDGELDALLAQPKPVLLYAVLSRSLAAGLGDLISGLLLIALSGKVQLGSLPVVLAAIVASALVLQASTVVFFSLAFWLGSVEAVARQLYDMLITISVYPHSLFDGALRIALFSLVPGAFVGYLPAQLLTAPSWANAAWLVSAAIGYCGLATWLFTRGLRSYCGGSRFGTFG
jgi:ABC-2 type transport system permease protein